METLGSRTDSDGRSKHPRQASSPSGMATLLEERGDTKRSLVTGRCELVNQSWSLRGANFSFIFSGIHWGTVGLIMMSLVLVLVMSSIAPTKRAYVPGDTSLAHALTDESIPSWVSVLVPIVMFVMMIMMGEFWLFRRCHKFVENGIIAFLFFLFDWASAMLVGMVWWRMSVVVVGEPRPDFFARCQMDYSDKRGGVCVEEGAGSRMSFFPLTPALAMLTAVYNANYVINLVYHRAQSCPKLRQNIRPIGQGGSLDRALEEIGHATLMYFILIQIAIAWAVSVFEIIDYRHFVADVNSAMIIGGIIGFVFSHRANSFYPRLLKKESTPLASSRQASTSRSSSSKFPVVETTLNM